MDQLGKVVNPAHGQLNGENEYSLSPYVPKSLVSRDGFSRPVPRQPAQWLNLVLTHEIPPDFRCGVHIFI